MTTTESTDWKHLMRETALALPNLVKLLARLVRDPRVPRRGRVLAAAALAYGVSPIDLVPDFIPVVGWIDDVIVVAFAVDRLMATAGREVVEDLWDGSAGTLEMVRALMESAADLVPRRIRRIIG
jgi:uncharacterized membrane protein YkvA (DUF1232 family)